MCDPGAPRQSAATARPRWTALYLAVATSGAGGLLAEATLPAGLWRALARATFATVLFLAVGLWIRHEAVALEQAEWCGCASSTVTMRVIASQRPRAAEPGPCEPVIVQPEEEPGPERELIGVQ